MEDEINFCLPYSSLIDSPAEIILAAFTSRISPQFFRKYINGMNDFERFHIMCIPRQKIYYLEVKINGTKTSRKFSAPFGFQYNIFKCGFKSLPMKGKWHTYLLTKCTN